MRLNKAATYTLPFSDLGGVGRIITALYFKQIAVLPPPVPFNVKIANDVIVHGKVQAAELPPAVLVEISKVPEYLDNLRPLNSVMTGGGPLPNGPGDLISSRTHLFVGFGSTETGHIQNAFPPRGDVRIPYSSIPFPSCHYLYFMPVISCNTDDKSSIYSTLYLLTFL